MSGRFSWILALVVVAISGALMGLIGSDDSTSRSPVPVPTTAESARADAVRAQLPGGDRVPAIVVVTRTDGGALSPSDLAAIKQQPVLVSTDGQATVATVPLDAGLSGSRIAGCLIGHCWSGGGCVDRVVSKPVRESGWAGRVRR